MPKKPSLIIRIAIGKLIGLVVGLIGFIFLPIMVPDVSIMLRWGVLLWYITVGAIIGVFGVFTWHPIFKLPMPWWFRAPLIGGWMNFVLTFFAYDQMQQVLVSIMGDDKFLNSPLWFVLEGMIIGLLIGYFATRFGGEGKKTIEEKN
ncbi:hypothetical protein N9W34_01315 [Rickettsiales bacterium]|nr:hypothetical protein [Rickettsiales bacterium]